MIWSLVLIPLIVLGWYWFEGRWDRRLFKLEPGRECHNKRARDAKALLEPRPDTQVLDVRSDAEFSRGALPDAIHLAIGDPAFRQEAAKLDKVRPVLVYCAGGYRSRKAVSILRELGFVSIHNLHRGFHSWRLAGLPVDLIRR